MKISSFKKALEKEKARFINEDSQRLTYLLNDHYLTASHNAGSDSINSIYVKRTTDKDDLQSDYFAGSFVHSIKAALWMAEVPRIVEGKNKKWRRQRELCDRAFKVGLRRVQTYLMTAANGKPVRLATMVIFNGRPPIKFTEKLNRWQAYEQALSLVEKGAL